MRSRSPAGSNRPRGFLRFAYQCWLIGLMVIMGLTGCSSEDEVGDPGGGTTVDVEALLDDLSDEISIALAVDDLQEAIDGLIGVILSDSRVHEAYQDGAGIEYQLSDGSFAGFVFELPPEEKGSAWNTNQEPYPSPTEIEAGEKPVITSVAGELCESVVGSQDVLVFAPWGFSPPNDTATHVKNILLDSYLGYQEGDINLQRGDQAQVDDLFGLWEYGIIIFDTHSGLATRTPYQNNHPVYGPMEKDGLLSRKDVVIFEIFGWALSTESVYGVRPQFIASLSGNFPNSLVINGACKSIPAGKSGRAPASLNYAQAFLDRGAGMYFGYDDLVTGKFIRDTVRSILESMALTGMNAGEAYSAAPTVDPYSDYHATLLWDGNEDTHLGLDFLVGTVNGVQRWVMPEFTDEGILLNVLYALQAGPFLAIAGATSSEQFGVSINIVEYTGPGTYLLGPDQEFYQGVAMLLLGGVDCDDAIGLVTIEDICEGKLEGTFTLDCGEYSLSGGRFFVDLIGKALLQENQTGRTGDLIFTPHSSTRK